MREEREEAVRERIEATRERMGQTIEQIGDRVNPDRVQRELKSRARDQVDEFKHTVKRKARSTMDDVQHEMKDTGRGIWDTIRENPIPAGMVGVGLAWLAANGGRSSSTVSGRGERWEYGRPMNATPYARAAAVPEDRSHGRMDEAREQAGEAVEEARHKGEEAMASVREKGEEALDSARERGEELGRHARDEMYEARDRARDWAVEAGHRAQRAERRVEDSVRENPLAAGAVAAALGFAAGMMVPETQREREMLGPVREKAMDRARETVHDAKEKARETVRETAGETARKVVDEAWSKSSDDTAERAVTEPGRA